MELVRELELADANRPDLADTRHARAKARRFEVHDDVRCALDRQIRAERRRQADGVAAPRHPRVLAYDLVQQRARETDRRLPQREQPPGRLVDGDGPAPLLDQLDEPIGRVEAQLHRQTVPEHMFDCKGLIYAAWRAAYPLTSPLARRPYEWAEAFCDLDREGMDS